MDYLQLVSFVVITCSLSVTADALLLLVVTYGLMKITLVDTDHNSYFLLVLKEQIANVSINMDNCFTILIFLD